MLKETKITKWVGFTKAIEHKDNAWKGLKPKNIKIRWKKENENLDAQMMNLTYAQMMNLTSRSNLNRMETIQIWCSDEWKERQEN